MTRPKSILYAALALFLAALAGDVAAQEMANLPASQMASQSLRPYWHVFIAYALTIGLVLGWVVSIGRRLARIEAQLRD